MGLGFGLKQFGGFVLVLALFCGLIVLVANAALTCLERFSIFARHFRRPKAAYPRSI